MKELKDPRKQSQSKILATEWHTHFSSVFSPITQPDFPTPVFEAHNNTDEILDHDFNVLELRIAMKKLKERKSPGPDRIPNEIWKILSTKSTSVLLNTFSKYI